MQDGIPAQHPPPSNPSAHPRDLRFPLSTRSRGASVSTTASEHTDEDDQDRDRPSSRTPSRLPRPASVPRPDSKPGLTLSAKIPTPDLPPPSHSRPASNRSFPTAASSSSSIARSRSESIAQEADYFSFKNGRSELSIVVVGHERCGKSSVIDKGFKHYRLGKPVAVPSRDPIGTATTATTTTAPHFTYTVRDGLVSREGSPDRVLHVLEVDSAVLDAPESPGHFTWPRNAPPVDAAIVCYDVSNRDSVTHVEALLRCFRDLRSPVIVFACKSDLDPHVQPFQIHSRIKQLDVGLVEVSVLEDASKHQLRLACQFVLRSAIFKRSGRMVDTDGNFNPASPDVLVSPPPWEISRASTATPTATTASGGGSRHQQLHQHQSHEQQQAPPPLQHPLSSSSSSASTPRSPTSPTRSRSASDLSAISQADRDRDRERARELDREKSRSTTDMAGRANVDGGGGGSADGLIPVTDHPLAPSHPPSHPPPPPPPPPLPPTLSLDGLPSVDEVSEDRSDTREKEGRPASWATLDELLEKLLFLAVSGDDAAFISHFLLTYRRFASPRSVVLAMQKRMRWLEQPSADPMFACFAQMRICHLLETWIQEYPHDFAVGQASGALNALVRSIVSKTHLLHYGSDFLPFLEGRPLVDKDSEWAMKVDESAGDENDDRYAGFDDGDDDDEESEDEEGDAHGNGNGEVDPDADPESDVDGSTRRVLGPQSRNGRNGTANHNGSHLRPNAGAGSNSHSNSNANPSSSPSGGGGARERKSSLPLSAKMMMDPDATARMPQQYPMAPEVEMSPKVVIRELQAMALNLERIEPDVIAQEITRIEAKLFAEIEPRHWLQHTLVPGLKDPDSDPIARFLEVSEHLAEWVVSLILCHDKTRARVRQVEKFIEIASRLRFYNNYSALRAFVAGIHKVTSQGDEVMETLRAKNPNLYKTFQSWEVLLQSARSHRAYRMALHNTKGACIPALEVHLQDLIKAHAGNTDVHPDDPNRIHWAKFNMMGKFIQGTVEYQVKCKNSVDYHFRETLVHAQVRQLFMRECKMDLDMQKARMQLSSDAGDVEEISNPKPSMFNKLLNKLS